MDQTFEEYLVSLGFDPVSISDDVRAALQTAYDAQNGEESGEHDDEHEPGDAAKIA